MAPGFMPLLLLLVLQCLGLGSSGVTAITAGKCARGPGDRRDREGNSVYDRRTWLVPEIVEDDAAVERFDFYILALSWQPEFCHRKEAEYPGCRKPQDYWRTHFTLHGLWPQRFKGSYPSDCGGDAFDEDALENALGLATLKQFWPNVKTTASSPTYASFWEHEWKCHGTCSGLEQIAYFTSAVNLLRNGTITTPTFVQQNVGKRVARAKLAKAYAGAKGAAVALQCTHGSDLSQVYTCWDKDPQTNRVTRRRACPESVLSQSTCHDDEVLIRAFP